MNNNLLTLIELAHELQTLSSAGLTYTNSVFDKERYIRISNIAQGILSKITDEPIEKIAKIFSEEDGYHTPRISTRAAIFNAQEEVLLVHDYDDKWVLPGGWCEYNLTIRENMVKEVREEAGLVVEPYRLVGIFDHHKRNHSHSYFYCEHVFMLCSIIGGDFEENNETSETGFFSLPDLPELNTHKTNVEQLDICMKAYKASQWNPIID